MIKTFLLALVVVTSARPATAPQTAQTLAAKYPLISYNEVRPGVLMEPRYSSDGQLCMFRLFTKQVMPTMNNFDLRLRDKTVDEILAELIPVEIRGQRAKDYGMVVTAGKITRQINNYENVSVEKMSTADQAIVSVVIKNRSCPN
jgi:hypothetical protein